LLGNAFFHHGLRLFRTALLRQRNLSPSQPVLPSQTFCGITSSSPPVSCFNNETKHIQPATSQQGKACANAQVKTLLEKYQKAKS
jgi:hypothetical protein